MTHATAAAMIPTAQDRTLITTTPPTTPCHATALPPVITTALLVSEVAAQGPSTTVLLAA